jgi:molecular chaperone DnaK
MSTTHAVGIDLGTTYSCIAYLNEQGEPVSIPNAEGEISTPSVVMYDQGEEVVGTEALRNAIMFPHLVVQNAKRYMGDAQKKWTIEGREYSPIDVSAAILGKLLGDARRQIGPIERAVITVPAQFSERQRLATVEAGKRSGLVQVDIINEPVAAALCYVLGTEGLWFTELASEQRILVYDLGGGTFDLSLVSYRKDQVRVIASTGDLHLGGIDWNQCLLNAVADQFAREFDSDPRRDPESLQHLALEVEQCKRSLTVRSRAALIAQHAGKRKTYQIERDQFNQLTGHLLRRTDEITRKLVNSHKRGAAHLDLTVLSTGGSSRMPMVQEMLSRLKGTTVSRSLSPDQSIAHGATYYAGMLLTNSEFVHSITDADAKARLSQMKQQSVNARALGILVRDMETNRRVPHYLIPPNTPLPATATKNFGTVVPNQKRVSLFIIESGAGTDREYDELGVCSIDDLPPHLPAESLIAVTISYDESARVTVAARDVTSGRAARTVIDRSENLVAAQIAPPDEEVITLLPVDESSLVLVPLIEEGAKRQAAAGPVAPRPAAPVGPAPQGQKKPVSTRKPVSKPAGPSVRPVPPAPPPRKPAAGEIIELPRKKTAKPESGRPSRPAAPDAGEQEFWKFAGH